MKLILLAIYLGIGAMLHAVFVGPTFDWHSAWTFGWLFGWPVMFFITFWAGILGLAILGAVIGCLYWWLDTFAHWRERRRNQKRKAV